MPFFGLEYARYENEHSEIFTTESSDRAFEEEVMLSGFGSAPSKSEGTAITYDDAQEVYTARYTMETIALAFSDRRGCRGQPLRPFYLLGIHEH